MAFTKYQAGSVHGPRDTELIENCQGSRAKALFKCSDCGESFRAIIANVRFGTTKSCGCFRKATMSKMAKTHGMSGEPIHDRWRGMRQRTLQGGRYQRLNPSYVGVTHDPRWDSFESFYADMAIDREGHEYGSTDPISGKPRVVLGRYEDEGDYTYDNCRWQTKSQSSLEAVKVKLILMPDGRPAAAVAKSNGIGPSTFHMRLSRSWSVEDAATIAP